MMIPLRKREGITSKGLSKVHFDSVDFTWNFRVVVNGSLEMHNSTLLRAVTTYYYLVRRYSKVLSFGRSFLPLQYQTSWKCLLKSFQEEFSISFLNQEKMEEGFCIPFKTQVCSVPPLSKFCKGKFPSKTSKIAEKIWFYAGSRKVACFKRKIVALNKRIERSQNDWK